MIIASHELGFVECLADRAVTVTGGRVTGHRSLGVGPVAGGGDASGEPDEPVVTPGPGAVSAASPPGAPGEAGDPPVDLDTVDTVTGGWPMWRDSLLVAGKDLRIEARSRVGLSQVAPFGIVALVLFAFALGPDRAPMAKGAPGLFWVAVLFCTVLAVQRSVSVESVDGARDGLRLSGLDPAGLFLGKSAAVAAQLVVLEVVLGAGVVLLYGARIEVPWLIVVSCLLGTIGLAATGTLYGALSAGLRVRETLLPVPVPAHRRTGAAGRHPHVAGRAWPEAPPRTAPRGSG